MKVDLKKKFQDMREVDKQKEIFFSKKKQIEKNFLKKKNGLKTCKEISNITDIFLRFVYEKVIKNQNISNSEFIICATGGYGRRHLAPFSDIDILFVTFSKSLGVEKSIKDILLLLWDMGLKVGHAVRTLEEIKILAKNDIIIQTSLLDNRIIAGNKKIFKRVTNSINDFFVKSNANEFVKLKIFEREKRLSKTDNNSFLLEPNIKESSGGLRDINLLFWYFKRIYKTDKFGTLLKLNILTKNEIAKLQKSMDFILTIRCFLHFINERPFERLIFDFQKIIAEKLKYKSRSFSSGTERFMKHYYLQIKNVKNIVEYTINLKNLSSANTLNHLNFLTKGITELNNSILINDEIKFLKDKRSFLNIFYDSEKKSLPLHPRSLKFICNNIKKLDKKFYLKKNVGKVFFEILKSNSINETFFQINDSGLLSKIIPEFQKINARSQFDLYHAYTVDLHILKALHFVKNIELFSEQKKEFKHPCQIFKTISNKLVLYLAVLLHDIGKGSGVEHNEKGSKLAKKILGRFNLSKKNIKEVSWLIKNHLIFSDYALNKDTNEYSVLKRFLKEVSSKERLKWLYVLTVADISSVNKTSWSSWKASLLKKLYDKCLVEFEKPLIERFEFFNRKLEKKINLVQKKVLSNLKNNSEKKFKDFCNIAVDDFWLSQSIQEISKIIDFFFIGSKLKQILNCIVESSDVEAVFQVTIVTNDTQNLLLRIVQKFLMNKMEVLEAKVFTLKNDLVVDIFKISIRKGIKYSKSDLEKKKLDIKNNLNDLLTFNLNLKLEKDNFVQRNEVLMEKISVEIDNIIPGNYTLVRVYCKDRPLLLYDILKVLINNELNIYFAKISTFGDFIEDTFYVKPLSIKQVLDLDFLNNLKNKIKKKLLQKK